MSKQEQESTVRELVRRRDIICDAISRESDRGAVLVGSAFLDRTVELLIRTHFRFAGSNTKAVVDPLFAPMGHLVPFRQRSIWHVHSV